MELRKEELKSQKWVIDIAGKTMPLDTVRVFIQTILICVLVYTAFNIGSLTAYEYVKIAAYFGANNCDATGCYTYITVLDGTKVNWERIQVNDTQNQIPVMVGNFTFS